MTTLPTRPDGGIDWAVLRKQTILLGKYVNHEFINREIAAHTRERCARWHDEQEIIWRKSAEQLEVDNPMRVFSIRIASIHAESAAAIRKMEV